ncbi:MAG: hypothetical protein LQ338_004294 [Usnochroma carphineum]|nr:MAG: hypothetical protein LQ338_004294 [Usnochroma carphineum]
MDSRASKTTSNASSIAKRALKTLTRPALLRRQSARLDRKSTRPARGGFAWKRQISGHWLEIRVVKDPEADIRSADMDTPETPTAPYPTPAPGPSTSSQRIRIPLASRTPTSVHPPASKRADSPSSDEKHRKSLVSRTKRILGIKYTFTPPIATLVPTDAQSRARETVDGASSALRDLVDKRTPPSGSTSASNLSATSIAGVPKQRVKWLRPSYRRQHTRHSDSSSVRGVMLGKPPVGTPNSDQMYNGSDAQQYFRVELTEAGAPTYLPSEARRIGTPPLPGSGPNAKLRGFFFDYNAPRSTKEQHEGAWLNLPMNTAPLPCRHQDLITPSSHPATPRSPGARLQRDDKDIDWFRAKVAVDEANYERAIFELNVPEHLPSSPLCPRHPKHRSGGKGVCVYHGRNRVGTDDVVDEGAGWR